MAVAERPNAPVLDPERCWAAVMERDERFDGTFVYAVETTGVYCRPTCASRRPNRPHVRFFPGADDAEAAGFRACRRCGPRRSEEADPAVELIARACRLIDEHPDERLTLARLGKALAIDPHHLQRTFKRLTGVSPRQYADARRLKRFKVRVQDGEPVTEALFAVGYGSSRGLYERAPDALGMCPATYRRGGFGERLGFTIVDCSLGRLLVAGTERGISAVQLGDGDGELEASLRAEFPAAQLERDDDNLGVWVETILRYLEGAEPHLDLPIDVRATAFQQAVWETLRSIPYGSTATYTEIATAIGRPTAVRAVARACATNPVSLIVPCHRVVRRGGDLAGYRWGIDRKRALLAHERADR